MQSNELLTKAFAMLNEMVEAGKEEKSKRMVNMMQETPVVVVESAAAFVYDQVGNPYEKSM